MLKALLQKAQKLVDLEAKLQGVNGYTGRGEIEFSSWKSGVRRLEVELRGVAGVSADVFVGADHIKTVPLKNGAIDHTFDTARGDDVPELQDGQKVEIRQHGDVILDGLLIAD